MGGLCSIPGSQQTISASSNNQLPCDASSLKQPSTQYSYGKAITVEQLDKLRLEFWSTRVGGDVNMWQALKSASEALISSDIDMARAILSASEITITNGSIGTCYDTSGFMYVIPPYCTSNPKELSANINTKGTPKKKITNAGPGQPLKLNIRICDINILLENATATNSILELKQLIFDKTKELENMNNGKRVPNCSVQRQRLMFMGKELKDHQRLDDVKIDENKILQVFLRPES